MTSTTAQARLKLATNPWNVPPPEEGMKDVWKSIGVSGLALLAAISFRHRDPGVEVGLRFFLFGTSASTAGWAFLRSRSERALDAIRNTHAAVREELSGSVLEATAEFYAQNVGALMDGADVPVAAVQQWFAREYGDPEPQPQSAAPTPAIAAAPTWFDWAELLDGDRHPHILILAGSGAGKTTLLEWIARNIAPDGRPTVWTTKRKDLQWEGLAPIGVGRKFDAIATAYHDAIATMTDRFSDLDADFEPIVIAWDEISACVSANKNLSPAPLLREAREAEIRLVAAPHGGQVSSIGLEGQSDVLACCTQIRLGGLAIEHARKLVRAKRLSAEQLAAIEQSERPCLVGDVPAQLPHLPKGWQQSITVEAEVDDSPGAIVLQVLEQHPSGATVRDIQRSTLGRKHGLLAAPIREALLASGEVVSEVSGGKTYYRLSELSEAETLVGTS